MSNRSESVNRTRRARRPARRPASQKGSPMRYLFVNADKREYVRLVDLGAPHGSKYFELTQYLGPADWQWTILLAQMLELTTPHPFGGLDEPCPLCWAGDRVFILRGDDESGVTLPA